VSALAASFGAGISWMMAMTKFEISYAYPFIGLNFILVTLSGVLLFGESLTLSKVFGTLLIVTGIVVVARGQVT
jgi:multidrug transporter EmrE-like cation transporter